MLRAAAWTGGLFALGGGVVHFFPGQFTEPLVLVVLGTTLFLVSGRSKPRVHPADAAPAAEGEVVAPASRITR